MEWYSVDYFDVNRQSKDETVNAFGKSLVSLCRELGVHVLNGRGTGDETGEFTYVSKVGCSVVDYILVDT